MVSSNSHHVGPFRMFQQLMQGRSFPLMVSLVVLLLFYPLFESPTNTLPDWPARVLFSLVPIAGVLVLHGQRWSFISLVVLGVLVLILDSVSHMEIGGLVFWLRALAAVAMYGFCTTLIVRSVFIREDLKDHPVYGGITGYMLIGVTFAIIYTVIYEIDPHAFHVDEAVRQHDLLPFGDLLYYSFICLTTLGIGDITPLNPFARSVTVVETVIGVMYVAIMIAQLILAPGVRKHGGSGVVG
ncbi:MAG: potassium channel family protein [Phycisphaerales bacterium]|nr:potassium channel family protein [Phycisphaerales bacterium]